MGGALTGEALILRGASRSRPGPPSTPSRSPAWPNGRVVKRYLGTGEFAQALADFEALDAHQRWLEAELKRDEEAQERVLDEQVKTLDGLASVLARAALVLAGYHQHDRGEWRKRRGQAKEDRDTADRPSD